MTISIDVEDKIREISRNLGFIDTPLISEGTHNIELLKNIKGIEEYFYIARKTGIPKGELQIVVSPKVDDEYANRFLGLDDVRSAKKNSSKGKSVKSSQYPGFDNRLSVGEFRGRAWRLPINSDLSELSSFLGVFSPKLSEQEKMFYSLPEESASVKETVIDEITFQAIKTRRGQPEFRKALLSIYGGKCCVTGSSVESVLEAAHIAPHTEETNYSVFNGLLLRADIHTLYDLNQVGVDGSGKVFVSENLKESEYWVFHGKIVASNICSAMSENLAKRFELFSAIC